MKQQGLFINGGRLKATLEKLTDFGRTKIAIACGNTFVLKPSERMPLLAARLVELIEEAGLPKGVKSIFQICKKGSILNIKERIDPFSKFLFTLFS